MADGSFEIKVPITVKGGREGDKVGKQIGEKIANALNKSLKSVGIGGGRTQSSASPSSGGGGFLGMSKGLSKVAGKLTIVGAAAIAILGVLKKASPYLKGILSMFSRAFMLFFRPFGDFLATLLRPLAIMLMKMAVSWLKFTRTKAGKAAVGGLMGAAAGAAIGSVLPGVGTAVGAIVGGVIGIINALFPGFLKKMATFSLAGWIWDKIKGIWTGEIDFTGWLWRKITGMWTATINFTAWLWEKIKSMWTATIDFSGWLWEKVQSIWNWNWDVGAWLKSKIKSIFGGGSYSSGGSSSGGSSSGASGGGADSNSYYTPTPGGVSSGSGISNYLQQTAKAVVNATPIGPITKIFKTIGNLFGGSYQTGTPFVPKDGLFQLHRGESVTPRVQNNSSDNQSIVLQPTININGGSNVDAEEIARRFSSMTMMELKSRGIA